MRERLLRFHVDGARGDAQPIARSLKASDDSDVELDRLLRACTTARRAQVHQRPIDDTQVGDRAQVIGDGLRDSRPEPGDVNVARDIVKISDANRSRPRRRGVGNRAGRRCPTNVVGRVHSRDEPVASPRDGLDVLRRRRVVAERLSQFGNNFCDRVVSHGDVGPQRREDVVLRQEHRGPIGE